MRRRRQGSRRNIARKRGGAGAALTGRGSQADHRTDPGLPVHSFQSLLADLATVARNTITTAITPNYPLSVVTRPTTIQHKAFQLLGVSCSQ
jgi:hypothetical protein